MFKTLKSNGQGFISVVALGILVLMTIVGLSVYETSFNTIGSIKNTNNYYHAQDMANSASEFLKWEINNGGHEYGYNKKITCGYGKFAKDSDDEEICETLASGARNNDGTDADVKTQIEIKGRATEDDKWGGNCPGTDSGIGCYTVPLPGKGTAGDRCNAYSPNVEDITKMVDDNARVGTKEGKTPQSEYSCNWNKLIFGSSSTDRVAIPLYYDTGDINKGEEGIINQFNKGTFDIGLADEFALRLRTPCLPCAAKGKDPESGKTRKCTGKNPDPTICKVDERYVLDAKVNDIVVQWQIVGTCKDGDKEEEQCGLIPYKGETLKGKDTKDKTASQFTEKLINKPEFLHNIVLNKKSHGLNTNTFPQVHTPIMKKSDQVNDATPLLPIMKKPTLTLMLSGKLLTDTQGYIPYLEYQFVTDHPIATPVIQMTAYASFNGNGFKVDADQQVERPMVDFVLQN